MAWKYSLYYKGSYIVWTICAHSQKALAVQILQECTWGGPDWGFLTIREVLCKRLMGGQMLVSLGASSVSGARSWEVGAATRWIAQGLI